jgi:hypothetical protein
MLNTTKAAIAVLIFSAFSVAATADPTPGATQVLGPFTGHDAKLHPDNTKPNRIAYDGTDLGFTYLHQGKIQFLFGDTSADENGTPIQASTGGAYDDSFGSINLADWPDAAKISANNIPLIRLGQNAGTAEMSAMNPGHPLESFKTPLGGFSNGTREFAVFTTAKPQGCRVDADCSSGMSCDAGVGTVGARYDDPKGLTLPCFNSTPGCAANTPAAGFCVDRTSSIWADTPRGRVSAVGVKLLVGERSTADPRTYGATQSWWTNKFSNVSMQSVQDFVPERGGGRARQDYRESTKAGGKPRVFLWGRPGFIGVGAKGRTLGMYFAYVDLPGDAGYTWQPNYYTGTDARGLPQFSRNERDAVAVDLDSSKPGVQPAEATDIVDQQSIVWVEHLRKWVMFFGGGMGTVPMQPALVNCGLVELFVGDECRDVVVGKGAVFMRTADDPWGPWTPSKVVIDGGDPAQLPTQGMYGPGGMLHHPACGRPGCARRAHSPVLPAGDYGFLYGVNLIQPWIKPVGKSVDVIWNASTWDPYRVILLRTRIDP